jgi:hypothetical protein
MVIARGLLITLVLLHAAPGLAAMRIAGEASLPYTPAAVAVDPVARRAFLAAQWSYDGAPTVTVVSLDSLTSGEIEVAAHPYRLLVDAARSRLFMTHYTGGEDGWRLSAVDTIRDRARGSLALGPGAVGIAADFGRGELYVTHSAPDGLWVIDADRLQALAKIATGPGPLAEVAVDRARRRLLAAGYNGAHTIIDLDQRSVLASRYGPLDCVLGNYGELDEVGFPFLWGVADSPIIDERSGKAYLKRSNGGVDVVGHPDYGIAASIPGCGGDYAVRYRNDQPAMSVATGRLFEIGRPADSVVDVTSHPPVPYFTLRSIDGRSGTSSGSTLPDADPNWRQTLVVDDDGGDLYATIGRTSSRLLRIDPESLAVRETLDLPGFVAELSFRDPATGRIFLAGSDDSGSARLVAIDPSGAKAGTRIATGFHHKAFDHHFVTADPTERRLIDDGRFGSDWQVTDDVFRVWSQPVAGSVPVCRFLSARFAPRSSHFYTPYAAECDALKQDGAWQFEGIAFHVALPDAAGACPAATEPLYRLYNEGSSGAPNHRYTTSTTTVSSMTATGWSAEGVGPGRVFACTPTLR